MSMTPITEHPALHLPPRGFAPMTDEYKLAVHLTHLRQLDPTAVYIERAGSTIVYYDSRYKPEPSGSCCRIVLDKQGNHRRIGRVGFDPRGSRAVKEVTS